MTAPTLIIGLGGIGSEIVSMVEKKANCLGVDTSNIKYILIDTDEHALRERKKNGFAGITIRISNNITVEQCLKMNPHAKEEWYPDNNIFMNKTLSDGAGQVRAISRLALEYAIAQEMLKPLHQVIFELHYMQQNSEAKTQRVALVSSLAGGTGSGLLLPFAAYLADYLKKNFPQNGYNMNGFFMMPDVVMHYGNGNQVEGMSLYSNAYATIKELDYFIQSNIGTVEKQEDMSLFHADQKGFSGTLYNFTFLFGLFNDNCGSAEGLKSLQGYKEMIADCIYLPYCSPINEKNTAWEDNKFKHLTIMLSMGQEKKYRHFGSIGVARLQYPYEKIKKYLTLCWAKDTMDHDWFYYDTEYDRYREEHLKQEKQGIMNGPMQSLRDYYAEKVDLVNRPLSQKIMDNLKIDNGNGREITAWETYCTELENYLTSEVDRILNQNLTPIYKKLRITQGNLKERGFLHSIKNRIDRYQNPFISGLNELSQGCAQVIQAKKRLGEEVFRLRSLRKEIQERYYLEYWLQNGMRGQMLHPNAVRYFLTNVQKCLKDRIAALENKVEVSKRRIETIWEGYQKLNKKGLVETIKEINDTSGIFGEQTRNEVLLFCYKKGNDRIEHLNKAYEELFEGYRKGLSQLDEKIRIVSGELTHYEGTRVKMLCNEKEYLEHMYQEMKQDVSSYYGALDDVSIHMFETAEQQSPKREKKTDYFFEWEQLLAEWEKNFQNVYGWKYDIDVISAAENQVLWDWGETNTQISERENVVRMGIEQILQYCANRLSAPFLSVAGVSEKEIIKECYFHTSLMELKGVKQEVVHSELIGKNGVWEDQAIDKYTICYYQSLFGVHANHLDAFKSEQQYTTAGNCFQAYDEITKRMHLNQNVNQILTPHLDRNWHKAKVLPEMSRELQIRREKEEWMALLYGCITGGIVCLNGNQNLYRIVQPVFSHKDCSGLLEVMEIIRDFREERDALNQARKKDFEEIFKTASIEMNYEQSGFIREYEKISIVIDIYLPYMNSLGVLNYQRDETERFAEAWGELLGEYFSMFEIEYEDKVRKFISKQINKEEDKVGTTFLATSFEEKVLEELKYELRRKGVL